ncbi:GAF domain-containing protein [Mycolicibacterium mengxianglii]|uniref:GAF domain-containing protein n=1 Tax=Mycolicibacterium mengxianglii TaxID=2736649 RepID=UPI0018D11972|nr:GAF domain-containing protein [Mycolicibacterium mengxianglii]
MFSDGAGFDDPMVEIIARQAAEAGETVAHYIQRAVAARLVSDMSRRADPSLDDLQRRLAGLGVEVADRLQTSGAGHSVVTDPARVAAVTRTGLLDAPHDPAFDRIARTAAEAMGTPSAAVTLLDGKRIFFLSTIGLPAALAAAREVPVGASLAAFAVESGHTLVVDDASTHPTLQALPFVRDGIVGGYLGIPLVNTDGYAVGTVAVWDSGPRAWTTGHVDTLHSFARMAWVRIFGTQPISGGT